MDMSEKRYFISEASKLVGVEAHVLRYWEEQLGLEIRRNEMDHRYYIDEDIRLMQNINLIVKNGIQLRAVKMLLPNLMRNEEDILLELIAGGAAATEEGRGGRPEAHHEKTVGEAAGQAGREPRGEKIQDGPGKAVAGKAGAVAGQEKSREGNQKERIEESLAGKRKPQIWQQRVRTGQEKVQEVQEGIQEGQEKVQEGQEKAQEGQEKAQAGQQRIQAGQEKAQEGQQRIKEVQQRIQEGQQRTQMGQEKIQPGQQKAQEGRHKSQEGQEKSQPGQQKLQLDQQQSRPGQQKHQAGQQKSKSGQRKLQPGQQGNKADGTAHSEMLHRGSLQEKARPARVEQDVSGNNMPPNPKRVISGTAIQEQGLESVVAGTGKAVQMEAGHERGNGKVGGEKNPSQKENTIQEGQDIMQRQLQVQNGQGYIQGEAPAQNGQIVQGGQELQGTQAVSEKQEMLYSSGQAAQANTAPQAVQGAGFQPQMGQAYQNTLIQPGQYDPGIPYQPEQQMAQSSLNSLAGQPTAGYQPVGQSVMSYQANGQANGGFQINGQAAAGFQAGPESQPGQAGQISQAGQAGQATQMPQAGQPGLASQAGQAMQPADMRARELRMLQFQDIMSELIGEALRENNPELADMMGESVTERVIKEMDYLMRLKEEQEEERYKRLDETIRSLQRARGEAAASLSRRERRRLKKLQKEKMA